MAVPGIEGDECGAEEGVAGGEVAGLDQQGVGGESEGRKRGGGGRGGGGEEECEGERGEEAVAVGAGE